MCCCWFHILVEKWKQERKDVNCFRVAIRYYKHFITTASFQKTFVFQCVVQIRKMQPAKSIDFTPCLIKFLTFPFQSFPIRVYCTQKAKNLPFKLSTLLTPLYWLLLSFADIQYCTYQPSNNRRLHPSLVSPPFKTFSKFYIRTVESHSENLLYCAIRTHTHLVWGWNRYAQIRTSTSTSSVSHHHSRYRTACIRFTVRKNPLKT